MLAEEKICDISIEDLTGICLTLFAAELPRSISKKLDELKRHQATKIRLPIIFFKINVNLGICNLLLHFYFISKSLIISSFALFVNSW